MTIASTPFGRRDEELMPFDAVMRCRRWVRGGVMYSLNARVALRGDVRHFCAVVNEYEPKASCSRTTGTCVRHSASRSNSYADRSDVRASVRKFRRLSES